MFFSIKPSVDVIDCSKSWFSVKKCSSKNCKPLRFRGTWQCYHVFIFNLNKEVQSSFSIRHLKSSPILTVQSYTRQWRVVIKGSDGLTVMCTVCKGKITYAYSMTLPRETFPFQTSKSLTTSFLNAVVRYKGRANVSGELKGSALKLHKNIRSPAGS